MAKTKPAATTSSPDFKVRRRIECVVDGKPAYINVGVGRKGVWRVLVLGEKRFWLNEMKEDDNSKREAELDALVADAI